MANDPVVSNWKLVAPTTNGAGWQSRVGANGEVLECYVFPDDNAQDHHLNGFGRMSSLHGGGDLLFRGQIIAPVATTGNVRMGIGFRKIHDEDIAAAHTYTYEEFTVTVSGTAGVPVNFSFTFPSASKDGVGANDVFAVMIRRESSDTGTDTLADEAWLVEAACELVEP